MSSINIASQDKPAAQVEGWDRWYASLPADLKRRLSFYDFKRLGDLFATAFEIKSEAGHKSCE